MKRLILATTFLLAGCFGFGQHVEPIRVPVPTNCVRGQIPQEPRHIQGELTGDSGVDIGIISGSAIELRAWGVALYGMLAACQATPESAAPLAPARPTRP